LRFAPGGKGSNQAVAASRLKAPTELVGRVGRDVFGDSLLAFLATEKVGRSGVRQLDDVATGTALIVVGASGDNTIVAVPGANYAMTPADADAVGVDVDDVVVVQFELPLAVTYAALSRGRRNGARTILNPAPAKPAPAELLRLADFLVVNETELAFFAGGGRCDGDIEEGLRTFRQRPEQVVIATLGAGGATALIGSSLVRVRGREVPVVDTTGAGDCFVGALAAALCSWADVEDAIHFANLAASVAVQRFGASSGMPVLADVEGLT
jgi:ribokinase